MDEKWRIIVVSVVRVGRLASVLPPAFCERSKLPLQFGRSRTNGSRQPLGTAFVFRP